MSYDNVIPGKLNLKGGGALPVKGGVKKKKIKKDSIDLVRLDKT